MLRFALAWQADPREALESLDGPLRLSLRAEALGEAVPGRRGLAVSIRREDRERFEETLSGARFRWVGETAAPGA